MKFCYSEFMQLPEAVGENKVMIAGLTVGVGLLLVGVVQMMTASKGEEVVIVQNPKEASISARLVVVDVAGAVNKPGVYRMDEGVRIAEVLAQAGGYAGEVDQEYVAKFINQAEKVKDGQKIYIPLKSEKVVGSGQNSGDNQGGGAVASTSVVNVNTASAKELDSLWGIGEARAEDIVANRPYGTVDELVTKAKIPQNVLEKNEGKISVY